MVSLEQIGKSIQPNWELSHWFQWPPNAFALLSIVLHRTGSYMICLANDPHWESEDWIENVDHDSQLWTQQLNKELQENEQLRFKTKGYRLLAKYYDVLDKDWKAKNLHSIDLNELRVISEYSDSDGHRESKLREYATALVSVLAIIDSCCAGMGVLGGQIPDANGHNTYFRTISNLLLTTTGSLSTIPKFHGTVLPKMRTPRSGIVLRSLSHHLTFHQTEVEVVWRTFPWLDDSKQHLNIMVVPFPDKVSTTDFEIVPNVYHPSRYFKCKISEDTRSEVLDGVVEHVCKSAASNTDIDMLVFPEMALSERQYKYILNKFAEKYKGFDTNDFEEKNGINYCLKLPIIIAGVLNVDDSLQASPRPLENEVRMAVFFAGKWYDITQRKHHRWQLDRSQVMQYGLEGYMSAERNWIELCTITQRRLTVLAPNGWLSLTALICEDLARQEPVSEVIRGIGPTLLTALLSDGPQINARWSARYASVLADDPGTSVLSITSKGMSSRSRKPDGMLPTKDEPLAIGLWKDLIKGWKVLELEEDMDALMFTVSSRFENEYTLDGRSDGSTSSVFNLDSIRPTQIKFSSSKSVKEKSTVEKLGETGTTGDDRFGNWHDIRILSAITYAVDAIVDLLIVNHDKEKMSGLLEPITDLFLDSGQLKQSENLLAKIKSSVQKAWKDPEKIGTSITKGQSGDIFNINEALDCLLGYVTSVMNGTDNKEHNIFELLISVGAEWLEIEDKSSNIRAMIAAAFLYNINTKLSAIEHVRDPDDNIFKEYNLSPKKTVNMIALINKSLIKHITA